MLSLLKHLPPSLAGVNPSSSSDTMSLSSSSSASVESGGSVGSVTSLAKHLLVCQRC